MAKKNIADLLGCFKHDTKEEHEMQVDAATGSKKQTQNVSPDRATALVSMTKDEKERLTSKAQAHGLSLSAFFRLADDE